MSNKDELVIPKLDKEELAKLIKEREERLEKETKKDVVKSKWPEQLTDIFRNLGKNSEKGLRLPNSKKERIASTKHKKIVKKQKRGQ